MNSEILTGPGRYAPTLAAGPETPINPLDASIPLADVVPPGQGVPTSDPDKVGKEIPQPPDWAVKFDESKLVRYVNTGVALQKANKTPLGGFNFAAMAAAMGTGAVIGGTVGTIVPIIGNAVGAAVGAVIGAAAYVGTFIVNILNRPSQEWANAAPGVHFWFNNFGPVEYLDWVRASNSGLLTNLEECISGLAIFWLERYGYVLCPSGDRFYSGKPDVLYSGQPGSIIFNRNRTMYESMGVDYRKTWLERYPAGTSSADIPGMGPDEQGRHTESTGRGGVWQKNWKIFVAREEQESNTDAISPTNILVGAALIGSALYISRRKK